MIQIKRKKLYSLSEKERKMVLRWRNNDFVRKNMDNSAIISLDEHARFINSLKNNKTKDYYLVYSQTINVGIIKLDNINTKNQSAEIGLYKNPLQKQSGMGTLLMQQIIKIAGIKKLKKLRLKVKKDNLVDINLYYNFDFEVYRENKNYLFMQISLPDGVKSSGRQKKLRIGLLVSGDLGSICLKKILSHSEYQIRFVLTDFHSQKIKQSCRQKNIPVFVGNPRKKATKDFLKGKKVDIILSLNYLFLIEKDIIEFPELYSINVHGSLLPKYRGRTPHVWAIINNEKVTGITAHLLVEECDAGDIILQEKIKINESDTGADLLEKYKQVYPDLVFKLLGKIKNNSIAFTKQDHKTATYYWVRTPDDGRIDWNWQKDRIVNWARAQAPPYPGAFTYFKNKKLYIYKIKASDTGYDNTCANGTILKVTSKYFVAKTPNGALEAAWNKTMAGLKLKAGDILQ